MAEQVMICGRTFREELSQRTSVHGLSEPEFFLLWACWSVESFGNPYAVSGAGPAASTSTEAGHKKSGPCDLAQNDLARLLAVSAAQVSMLVERLRRKGFLEGRRATVDRRRRYWRLTEAGQTALAQIVAALADWADQLDAMLGRHASDDLARLVTELTTNLRSPSRRQTDTLPPSRTDQSSLIPPPSVRLMNEHHTTLPPAGDGSNHRKGAA